MMTLSFMFASFEVAASRFGCGLTLLDAGAHGALRDRVPVPDRSDYLPRRLRGKIQKL